MSSTAISDRRELPPRGPRHPRLRTILTAIALSALYLLSLWLAITEAGRRSVSLEIPPQGADYLILDVSVVHVDLLRSEMTTRISFHLAGQLVQDEVMPATDLQLILNTVHGQQQFDFAKGKRINSIEAVFPLQGEVNFYPFDHHTGVLWFFATIPEAQKASSTPTPEPTPTTQEPAKSFNPLAIFSSKKEKPKSVPNELEQSPGLPVGIMAIRERVQADTKVNFSASIPGLTFRGSQSVQSADGQKGLTGIEVHLGRSLNVIFISVTSMLMMAAMAVGLVAMVLKIVSGTRRMANFHIPMAVSLMFGLPALRNVQPGVPPIGTFGDSVAFIWAEVAAAGSAIALVIHWLLHRTSEPLKDRS
jgi:hypothetical protein